MATPNEHDDTNPHWWERTFAERRHAIESAYGVAETVIPFNWTDVEIPGGGCLACPPTPHRASWAYVTLGLTQPASAAEACALRKHPRSETGYGAEFAMFLGKPAEWPIRVLRQLMWYVRTRQPINAGDRMPFGAEADADVGIDANIGDQAADGTHLVGPMRALIFWPHLRGPSCFTVETGGFQLLIATTVTEPEWAFAREHSSEHLMLLLSRCGVCQRSDLHRPEIVSGHRWGEDVRLVASMSRQRATEELRTLDASEARQRAMGNIDPIELELFRNFFEAAADEMGITLQRVAFSANIKERRDFSCALFDASGELLAQAAHIPVHLGSIPASVAAVRAALGNLDEGDVAIVNDPFAGGTHLPDITILSPIFHGGVLAGYAANRAHHADVGGSSAGSMTLSRQIDEEGIRIEPSLLYRRGVRDEALLNRFLSAVRTPDERLGDLDAQLAANAVGARAMHRMLDRHGPPRVAHYGRALLDYSQAFMRRTLSQIPAGEWRFEDALDDDGAGNGPIVIRVLLRSGGSRVMVDLTGSDPQVPGCVNCPQAVTHSAAYYCFACLLGPGVPLNAGCFRDIEILTKPGTVVHARHPAAVVAGNTETSQRVVDVIFGALAQALPNIIPATSCGTMNSVALGGDGWTYYETIGGGSGATPTGNGASCVQCHMTNTLNTPAEVLEMQYPLRVRRFERARGTGGQGLHTGGDGTIRHIEALAACEGTLLADRRLTAPYGLSEGEPGTVGDNRIARATGEIHSLLGGKHRFTLAAGDILQIRTPGGGGWGSRKI